MSSHLVLPLFLAGGPHDHQSVVLQLHVDCSGTNCRVACATEPPPLALKPPKPYVTWAKQMVPTGDFPLLHSSLLPDNNGLCNEASTQKGPPSGVTKARQQHLSHTN